MSTQTTIPQKDMPLLGIDFGQADQFLKWLDENAESFTFQTFDDNKARRAGHLTKVFNGTFAELKDELARLNRMGAGVYVTVNATDGIGRKIENIIHPRALWIEDDQGSNLNVEGLEPHMIVQSSAPHKQHRYYRIADGENVSHEEWQAVEDRLVFEYGSDPNARDIARVLRLPGFFHIKNPANPLLVQIIHESGEKPYPWSTIVEHIPPVAAREKQRPTEPGDGSRLPELRSALAYIDPDGDETSIEDGYSQWIKVGAALHHATRGSVEGFNLWDEWSAGLLWWEGADIKGFTYEDREFNAYKWRSFKTKREKQVTAGSVYWMASKAGWPGLPVEEGLAMNKAIIEDAYTQLCDDIAAMYSSHVLEALAYVKEHESLHLDRIYHKVAPFKIASELKKKLSKFVKSKRLGKKSALPALPALLGISEDYTNHQASTGISNTIAIVGQITPLAWEALVITDLENLNRSLMVQSKAAAMLVECFTGALAYDEDAMCWHGYVGTHWQPIPGVGAVDKLIIDQLTIGTGDLGFSNAYKNNIKALITDGGRLPLPVVNHDCLPFKNGLLCIESKTLTTATPKAAHTWCLPYEYESGADCPTIKTWLSTAVDGDNETVEFLRAWLAALLHGRADLQKFLHLIGSGGTGKSTFMRLASLLVGSQNTATTNLKAMENNQFETANFYGKRLVMITDSDKYGGSLNTLKAMTGQDIIRLERKHQQQAGGFVFDGLVVLASNENLTSTDHTSGLERRRLTAPFDRRVTDDEKAEWERLGGEKSVLHPELPGLVNWLLELSQDEISVAIRNPPKRTKAANLEAMQASNPLAAWLRDNCLPNPAASTQIGSNSDDFHENDRLYPNYKRWCGTAGVYPMGLQRFGTTVVDTVKTLGHHARKPPRTNQGRFIEGLQLRDANIEWFDAWDSSL